MGTKKLKPIKIKLNNGTAGGMYIVLTEDEVRYTKTGETRPPNRIYKIEIAVEAMHHNKRCRGKSLFSIPKGTSISKAVGSLLGKREDMKKTLKENGTLKSERKMIKSIKTTDRTFDSLYVAWIEGKKINKRARTISSYEAVYRTHLIPLKRKIIDDITEDDIQNIINTMINNGKSPSLIYFVKVVTKQILELYDVRLNWKRIILPAVQNTRSFDGDDEQAKLIAKTLLGYKHPVARGVFAFLLSGRRINETLQLEHSNINYNRNTFTLPAEITKNKTEATFELSPLLLSSIKSQKTTSGKIFTVSSRTIRYHFDKAMTSINVHGMVLHDLRSMVAVTALRNGADIYAVSKMLAHKLLSTTEKRYLGDHTERAVEAQRTFSALLEAPDEVIDVDVVVEDEFAALKRIYPDAPDEKIQSIIRIMNNKALK